MSKKCDQGIRERIISGGSRAPVYAASVAVCVGAVCTGIALAWTSNVSEKLEMGQLNGLIIETMDLHWTVAMMTMGCCTATLPVAVLLDTIGRKATMIIATFPLYVGYTLILFARHRYMLFAGRFISGLGASGFSCCCPLYASEIAHKNIRGRVVSFYFMFVSIGFVYANIFGWLFPIKLFIFACIIVPVIFTAMFFFQPKSPVYAVQSGRITEAVAALKELRGSKIDVMPELKIIKLELSRNVDDKSFFEMSKDRGVIRGLIITVTVLLLKHLVGATQVLTFTSEIVKSAGFNNTVVKWSVISGGLIQYFISSVVMLWHNQSFSRFLMQNLKMLWRYQVLASFVSLLYVDRVGRRLLLIIGFSVTFLSSAVLGVYYTFYDRRLAAPSILETTKWIPLISLAFYWFGYGAGLGNIAALTAVEIFPADIRAKCKCITEFFNWLGAFLVTLVYVRLGIAYGWDINYYYYSFFSIIGILVTIFMYPEATMKDTIEVFEEIRSRKHIFRSHRVPI